MRRLPAALCGEAKVLQLYLVHCSAAARSISEALCQVCPPFCMASRPVEAAWLWHREQQGPPPVSRLPLILKGKSLAIHDDADILLASYPPRSELSSQQ